MKERLTHPFGVWVLASIFFLVFALLARTHPAVGRAYVWTLVVGVGGAWLIVLICKASEGLVAVIEYFREHRWYFSDDPLDKWVVVILGLLLQGLAMMWWLITPTMPRGVAYWP